MNDDVQPRRSLPKLEAEPGEGEPTLVREVGFSYEELQARAAQTWPSASRPRPAEVQRGTALGRPRPDGEAADAVGTEPSVESVPPETGIDPLPGHYLASGLDAEVTGNPEAIQPGKTPGPSRNPGQQHDAPAGAIGGPPPSDNEFRRPAEPPPPLAGEPWAGAAAGLPAATASVGGPKGPRITQTAVASDEPQRRLRRSLLLTLASAALPGSGLLGAPQRGLRVLGGMTAGVSLVAVSVLGWRALTDLSALTQWAQRESTLTQAPVALALVTLLWVALIALTQVVTRPPGTTGTRRVIGAVLVTALAFGVAAPTAVAARYSRDASLMLDRILPQATDIKASNREPLASTDEPDPWAHRPRVNILLLGADGNAAREQNADFSGLRTDTIMVASIETATGNTTLIQIPRNVQYTPFPEGSEMAEEFPRGFRGEGDQGEWFINTIWEKTDEGGDYAHIFEGSTFPGAEALKQGVQGVTGLKIDRFAMLNIDGLSNLINAMGGVEINVNRELPIGGNASKGIKPSGYIEVGKERRLDGYHAMWYARSRYDSSDYDRMARQSCLVDAIISQANPETLVTSFEPIAAASAEMVSTDITRDEFGAFIDLTFRVKDKGTVTRLVFAPGKNGYSFADPDFDAMREAVELAINPTPTATPTNAPPTASVSGEPSATASPSMGSAEPSAEPTRDEQKLTDGAQNVADACAWQG